MRALLLTLSVAFAFQCVPQDLVAESHVIDSAAMLERVVGSCHPGDSIIVKNGAYKDWKISLDGTGNKDAPIIIRGESAGGVVLSGTCTIKITGKHLRLMDLVFENFTAEGNSTVQFDGAESCSVSRIGFSHGGGNRPVVQFQSGASNNIIEDCVFADIAGRSVHVQVNSEILTKGIPVHNVIRNNMFRDIPPLYDNGRETVKIGQDQPQFGHVETYTLVEGNTFLRCDGESEIVSNKSSSNTFRNNTFLDSQGELVMRGGSNCLIEGNRFLNCSGGIRLSGTGHTVLRNVVITPHGTGIRLLYGMTKDQGGHYQAVSHCIISDNTIIHPGKAGILIGDGRNIDWKEKGVQEFAPENNRIVSNLIIDPNNNFIVSVQSPDNVLRDNILRSD